MSIKVALRAFLKFSLLIFSARNSFLHNMAIELLIAGHHKTFEEILVLVEQRKTEILKAGVDSVLWEVAKCLEM